MGDSWDVFISYSRGDNLPSETGARRVSHLSSLLEANDSESPDAKSFDLFFDTSDIQIGDRWWDTIRVALLQSKVLLAFVSRAYFASYWCRREWEEYDRMRGGLLAAQGAAAVIPVFLEPLPASTDDLWRDLSDTQGVPVERFLDWRDALQWIHGVDLTSAFGATDQDRAEVNLRQSVSTLSSRVTEIVAQAAALGALDGNVTRPTSHFVGRQAALDRFHGLLTIPRHSAAFTVLHGLGGLGKTELMEQYAFGHRNELDSAWSLRAGGHRNLLALLATLADVPEFQFALKHTTSTDGTTDPTVIGREVLMQLRGRASAAEGRTILVALDNVTEAKLLSSQQMEELPASDGLKFACTTRLGEHQFANRTYQQFLEIGCLDTESGVELIRSRQPEARFADKQQEEAARRLADRLQGHTLALERVAEYLGNHPNTTPDMFLTGLEEHGFVRVQEVIDLTLDQTLIEMDVPTSTALTLASLLPRDAIPWPWLRRMIGERFPKAIGDLFDPEGGWASIRYVLSGARLLTETNNRALARLNGLLAEHLSSKASEEEKSTVEELLIERAAALATRDPHEPWEPAVLLDALLARLGADASPLAQQTDRAGLARRVNYVGLIGRISQHVGDERPEALATVILALLADSPSLFPSGRAHEVATIVALNNLGGQQRRRSRELAEVTYGEALDRALALASSDSPTSEEMDLLATSHGNIATVLDSEPAVQHAREALRLRKELSTEDPAEQLRLVRGYEAAVRMLEKVDPITAMALGEEALPVARHLVGRRPDDVEPCRAMGTLLTDLTPCLRPEAVKGIRHWPCSIPWRRCNSPSATSNSTQRTSN